MARFGFHEIFVVIDLDMGDSALAVVEHLHGIKGIEVGEAQRYFVAGAQLVQLFEQLGRLQLHQGRQRTSRLGCEIAIAFVALQIKVEYLLGIEPVK